jgi:hypothetical protein
VRPLGLKRSDQLKYWVVAGLQFVKNLPKK